MQHPRTWRAPIRLLLVTSIGAQEPRQLWAKWNEYEGMKEDFLLELKKEIALLRKKMKKTSKTTPVQKPLKVSIID